MALAHSSQNFSVNDAAVYKLTTDPSGANPTYAAKVDVAGVQELTSSIEMELKRLYGDNTLIAVQSIFRGVKGKLTYGRFNFDLMGAITTASATDSGTTPFQKTVITLAQFDLPAKFKMETQTKQVDYVGGDMHELYWKCTAAGLDMLGHNNQDFKIQVIDFETEPLIGTPTGYPANSWVTAIANETAVAIV